MADVASIVAQEIQRLRIESATNLASLSTEMEERYREKFQKYKKREEALLCQVKHAVERAENFGKYQASEEFETKVAELQKRLMESVYPRRTRLILVIMKAPMAQPWRSLRCSTLRCGKWTAATR